MEKINCTVLTNGCIARQELTLGGLGKQVQMPKLACVPIGNESGPNHRR